MIKYYEIHVLTNKNLSDIEKVMQENGLQFMKKLAHDGIVYSITRSGKLVDIMVELYKETDEGIEYQFKVSDFDNFNFINEFVKKL